MKMKIESRGGESTHQKFVYVDQPMSPLQVANLNSCEGAMVCSSTLEMKFFLKL